MAIKRNLWGYVFLELGMLPIIASLGISWSLVHLLTPKQNCEDFLSSFHLMQKVLCSKDHNIIYALHTPVYPPSFLAYPIMRVLY